MRVRVRWRVCDVEEVKWRVRVCRPVVGIE